MTATGPAAHLSVYDGAIAIKGAPGEDTDIAYVDGNLLVLRGETDPWGEDEHGLERADELLAVMGWQRAGDWDDGEFPSCQVRPFPGPPRVVTVTDPAHRAQLADLHGLHCDSDGTLRLTASEWGRLRGLHPDTPGYIDLARGHMWFRGSGPGGQTGYPVRNAHLEQVRAAEA